MSATRVLLVDDQPLFREGLAMLLSVQPGVVVAGEAGDGAKALELVRSTQPDVVLMDIRMPNMDGVTAIRRLREEAPSLPVIALTTYDDTETLMRALQAGAAGFLMKDVDSATLMAAIEAVRQGLRLAPAEPVKAWPLSQRERQILSEVARGASNKEIAERLFLAEGTVKNHVTNILSKLGVRDRTQAALRARDVGLV